MVYIILLAAICCISYIMKIPYFKLPLDRDYGAHGYIAYRWLKGTDLMYRDIYESKTPGLKLIYMFIIKYFGINRKSFRQFFAYYNVLTTIAVYLLGAVLLNPAAGLIAALLFALYSSVPSLWWHFSNMESYYSLPMVLSILFYVLGSDEQTIRTLLYLFLSGFFSSITFMFKQPSLINTTAPILLCIAISPPHSLFLDGLLYCAGYCIPVIIFFVYFLVLKKTPWAKMPFSKEIMKLITGYLKTPLSQANKVVKEHTRRRFRTIFSDLFFLITVSVAGVLFFMTSNHPNALLIGAWIGLAFISAIFSRTYLPYHFIPTVAPMCVAGGVLIFEFFSHLTTTGLSNVSVSDCGSAGAILVLFLFTLYQLIKDLLMSTDLLGNFYSGEDKVYAICEEVGKYIKRTTKETDYVYSWGHQPDIYLWSERRAPVYCIYPPITNPLVFSKEHIAEELRQLDTNKPVYFVITSEFGQFKEFEHFLTADYTLIQKFEPFLYLFKLKNHQVSEATA
ncbi:MAG: hypothetical protein JW915_04440 [Chitinispirillaceae bacterium]|nr:hypothetical protein [Chitinispirillaceae bacterium]